MCCMCFRFTAQQVAAQSVSVAAAVDEGGMRMTKLKVESKLGYHCKYQTGGVLLYGTP